MQLALRLLSRSEAERVVEARRGPEDPPWAPGYPLEGDVQACSSYLSRTAGQEDRDPWGYYQLLLRGEVVGGAGFHGPPAGGVAEIGYGVVPSARGRGVATAAVVELLDRAARLGVKRVVGRTTPDNVASQKVMLGAGMRQAGRQGGWLCFEIDLEAPRELAPDQ